jgi:hypothetical protein
LELQLKLRVRQDLIKELDRQIDSWQAKGGNDILRIDLDDFEWELFMEQSYRLRREGFLTVQEWSNAETDYKYRGIPIVRR